MSDSPPPGAPPPEVPEEFAAAYRAAYERALEAQSEGSQHRAEREPEEDPKKDSGPDPKQDPEKDPKKNREKDRERDSDDTDELPARRGRLVVGTHRTEQYDDEPTLIEKVTDSPWFVPLLLTLLALLLILGAYAVGRTFADKVNDDAGASADREGIVTSEGGSSKARQPVSTQAPGEGAWDGKVTPVKGVSASATCTAPPGQDASGGKVSYGADHLVDGVADTTWRCDGAAVGKKITLRLPEETSIGEVGLIPGYAKTDGASGEDRYAENNRVTLVRWTIGDRKVEQKMDGSADDRSLRVLRVPKADVDEVGLEILAVAKGPRNTTAISEVQLSRTG